MRRCRATNGSDQAARWPVIARARLLARSCLTAHWSGRGPAVVPPHGVVGKPPWPAAPMSPRDGIGAAVVT